MTTAIIKTYTFNTLAQKEKKFKIHTSLFYVNETKIDQFRFNSYLIRHRKFYPLFDRDWAFWNLEPKIKPKSTFNFQIAFDLSEGWRGSPNFKIDGFSLSIISEYYILIIKLLNYIRTIERVNLAL